MSEELSRKAKQLFDDSVDGLDAATLSRLNRGRQEALASAGRRGSLIRWAPAGGLATAAIVAVVLVQSPTVVDTPPGSTAADFEILLGEDSLDMLEDLEFYDWLDSADAGSDADLG
ncbi:MAG: hypothetical protein AAGA33_00845 [Pseudomonadota bacterium]